MVFGNDCFGMPGRKLSNMFQRRIQAFNNLYRALKVKKLSAKVLNTGLVYHRIVQVAQNSKRTFISKYLYLMLGKQGGQDMKEWLGNSTVDHHRI
ncbi:hypothetical protein D3C87_1947990 [compost metagenome]